MVHRLDPAFELVRRQVAEGVVPFAILGIADARGVIRLEAAAPPVAPGSAPIGTGAVCLLASITKPIVATAVASLAQAGRFPLSVPLSRWLPELDRPGIEPFTAWHVLSHTTGFVDLDLGDLLRRGLDRAELLRRVAAGSQAWSPGSRFAYTSFTFDLLAEAVARAVGRPFPEILRETVLDPLGMADTTFDPPPGRPGGLAPIRPGNWDGSGAVPPRGGADEGADEALRRAFCSLGLAGGGLWSTARDLLRFGRAMLRGGELDGVRILSRPVLDLMTREVTTGGLGAATDRLQDEHYALGWSKPRRASPASPAAFGHGGVSGTRLLVDPAHDLVLVYLSGRWGLQPEVIDEVVFAAYGSLEEPVAG